MNNIAKILGAFTTAGIVAVGGSAFTAGGVTNSTTGTSGFIGGTVTQTSTGADLANVAYATDDTGTAKDDVNAITLTFSTSVQGHVVTANLSDGTPANDVSVTCVTATVTPWLTAVCTPSSSFVDLETLDVRVS